MAPTGDLASLDQLETDLTLFRKSLDDKQPIVQSNLASARQLMAQEPSLNDASDSDCELITG